MIFKGFNKAEKYVVLGYESTWELSQEIVFDAAQVILDTDFEDKVQRIVSVNAETNENKDHLEEFIQHNRNLLECNFGPFDSLVIAGRSSIMEVPVQFAFYVGESQIRVFVFDPEFVDKYGEKVFDNYMSSIEINAYCRNTERRVLRRIEKEKQQSSQG